MNAEKYTQKSMEAVRDAQELVVKYNNMQIDQQHLMYALIGQEGGVVGRGGGGGQGHRCMGGRLHLPPCARRTPRLCIRQRPGHHKVHRDER